MIMTLILIIIAAIAKAIADTIVFHGGGKLRQIFGAFFDINVPGKFLPHTKYPLDGFHIANSLMIVTFVWIATDGIVEFVLGDAVFILVFNLFWNKILK